MPGAARVSVRSRRGSRGGFRQPRSWREALQDSQSRMRVTDPPCQTPSVMPATVRTLSGRGALDRARRNSQRQSRPRTGPWFGEGSGKGLAIRHSGDVLLGGASGAGPEPELHGAGVSRFSENGSHLEAADTAEGHAGQVERSGVSENAGIGSHLAAEDFSDEPGAIL